MKFRCLSLIAGLGALAGLCLTSTEAHALLTSIKSTGMAAAAVAYPQDTLAGAFNPAGMVDVGNRVDVGIFWEEGIGGAHVHGNQAPLPGTNGHFNGSKQHNIFGPDLGINKMLCDCSMSFGLIAYNRSFSKTHYSKPFPLLGTTYLGMEYINQTIAPVFAWKICDRHSLGVSLDIQVQTLRVHGIENFDNAFYTSSPGHVTNNGRSWSSGVGGTLGWKWDVTDCLSLGIAYSPKTHMSKFRKYRGFPAQKGRIDVPERTTIGFAWHPISCATVAFDVQYIRWSKIRSLNNPLLNDAGNLNELGHANGPGFGWKSQIFYRLGFDYRLNDCWTVRAGYRYATGTIRKSQTAVNLLTLETVQNAVTVGATWALDCRNEISFFYAHGFKKEVKGRNSIPASFVGGEVDLHQQKNAAGVSWGYLF